MTHKIAIITTEFLVDYIHSAFEQIQPDCPYTLYTYRTFRDVPNLYRQIPEDVAGVLTSGSFPAQVIRRSFPDTKRVIHHFNTDDTALCQLFLRLLDEDRELDIDRIHADLLEMFSIDLRSYIKYELPISLLDTTSRTVQTMSLEELFQIEELEYQKHLFLWQKGQVDLCVTRFSSLVEPLRDKGIPVIFPYPSLSYLREVLHGLFREMDLRRMQENCAASILVCATPDPESTDTKEQEYRSIAVQAAFIKSIPNAQTDYFFRQNASSLELLTTQKKIEELTGDYRICAIQQLLQRELSFPVCVGYGIGPDIYHSAENARSALLSAQQAGGGNSFLKTDHALTGPLDVPKLRPRQRSSSPQITLSPQKLREVMELLETMPEGRFTSQALADRLGITRRSANRILSYLTEEKLVSIDHTRPTAAKGRPERIYRLTEGN